MLIDFFGLFANLVVLFAYVGAIFLVSASLCALLTLLGFIAADWSERSTKEQQGYREVTSVFRGTSDVSMLATFICYLVAAEQGRSDAPRPKYIVGRLLYFAEQFPAERQRFVREAIRTAKKAGLKADVLIDHAEPTLLRSTVATMRDELQDWGTDGLRLAEYVLQEHEVH